MTISSSTARVFWLTLPPMRPAQRISAAKLALRARIAATPKTMITLGTQASASQQWCCVVWEADAVPPKTDAAANAALTPWTPNTVSWRREEADPHLISATGSSVSLEPGNTQCPDALVQACAQSGVAALNVYGPATDDEAKQWHAQLGIPVHVHPAVPTHRPSESFLPAFSAGTPMIQPLNPRASATSAAIGLSPTIAAIAGLCFAVFGGWQWLRVNGIQQQLGAEIAKAQERSGGAPWREYISKRHPAHARDSASQLLEITLPALSPTASQLKTLRYESRALSIEWLSITDAERDTFASRLQAQGFGVIAAGNKARVVWP